MLLFVHWFRQCTSHSGIFSVLDHIQQRHIITKLFIICPCFWEHVLKIRVCRPFTISFPLIRKRIAKTDWPQAYFIYFGFFWGGGILVLGCSVEVIILAFSTCKEHVSQGIFTEGFSKNFSTITRVRQIGQHEYKPKHHCRQSSIESTISSWCLLRKFAYLQTLYADIEDHQVSKHQPKHRYRVSKLHLLPWHSRKQLHFVIKKWSGIHYQDKYDMLFTLEGLNI